LNDELRLERLSSPSNFDGCVPIENESQLEPPTSSWKTFSCAVKLIGDRGEATEEGCGDINLVEKRVDSYSFD
jgi:hypothetical protein